MGEHKAISDKFKSFFKGLSKEKIIKNNETVIRQEFQEEYDNALDTFLSDSDNYYMTERDFLEILIKQTEDRLTKLKSLIHFGNSEEPADLDDNWENKQMYHSLNLYQEFLKVKLRNSVSEGDLTPAEIVIREIYFIKAKRAERPLLGGDLGRKYAHLRSPKNIEQAWNDYSNERKSPTVKQLQKVYNALAEYPNIQKAIENDIEKLM